MNKDERTDLQNEFVEWLNDKEREEVESIFAKIERLTDEQKKQLEKLLTAQNKK